MNLKSSYTFDVNLDYGASRLIVNQTVKITNKSNNNISTLNFSVIPQAFGEFSLKSVTEKGESVNYFWTNNSTLAVNLNNYLNPDEQTTIEINFVLNPSSDTTTYLKSSTSKANGIMQLSSWFPVLSNEHPMRMPGDSQFTVTADSFHMDLKMDRDMPLAAPGTISSPTSLTRTVDFGPARNFVFSVSPNYLVKTDSIDGITIKVYHLSGTAGGTALANAKNSLNTFNSRFIDYPYEKLVIAQGSASNTANEFPGMIFIGSSWLNSLNVVRHEVAHQWFYGMLGNDQMNDPWIDEAFAEWAGRGFQGHSYCSSKIVSSSIYDFPNAYDYSNDTNCGSYNQTVYYKGADFIEGVRNRMGNTAFFNSLNNLLKNYKFGVVTTSIVANNWLNYAPKSTKNSLKNYMQQFINW